MSQAAISIPTMKVKLMAGQRPKRNVVFIGGGAATGALIGAIAGGGKGAGIGAVSARAWESLERCFRKVTKRW